MPWIGDTGPFRAAVEAFLAGLGGAAPTHSGAGGGRVLATVLFTDIVDSTEQLAAMGDAQWRARLARAAIERHRGEGSANAPGQGIGVGHGKNLATHAGTKPPGSPKEIDSCASKT